jgi:ribonucleoside-diphosphate reductase alpha chain
MTPYQQYIYKSRYARYLSDEKRREEWPETVARYINFFRDRNQTAKIPWAKLEKAILNFEIMPSMRCLMTAGKALERDNVSGYNCAYTPIDHIKAFDEILYILMCGTGMGFSVERQYISKLPEIAEEFHETETIIVVRDSKIGWAKALRELITLLYSGQIPQWDLSNIRPAGAVLKTFGGRSSGPEPLDQLFKFCVGKISGAKGRKLNSLEVHDVICKIAEVVVCGGVRRSALLSLSNLTDARMLNAKQGEWFYAEPQRSLANNSVAYTELPDMGIFMQEWKALHDSKAGERGIFNREACNKLLPSRRNPEFDFGTNPCSEIVLRPQQFCNLTEVICRSEDTPATLLTKIELATILGTLQSTLIDFRYLRKVWSFNTMEERLLGVSLTGIMDNRLLSEEQMDCDGHYHYDDMKDTLNKLKEKAIETNKKYSKVLEIPVSSAVTCVKPSGTVSQLVDSSSGIHPRYSDFYVRRVRSDVTDPLSRALQDAGVPNEISQNNPRELVFSFPISSPDTSTTISQMGAITQLEHWKVYATSYCEHKPSVSIYVKDTEWMAVGAWVYKNWEYMSGVSFFPHDDHMYPQAPYEKITEEQYKELADAMPKFNLSNLIMDEEEDVTTSSQELACVGGACEL